MSASCRLSVRLNQERWDRLEQYCQEAGYTPSTLVRRALDAYLSGNGTSPAVGAPPHRLAPPEQIGPLMPKYRAWANGDLRKHRNKLFADLLAASFITKQHYPRTPGMLEGYEGLRQLCRHFGLED